jgi:hypothetical protein
MSEERTRKEMIDPQLVRRVESLRRRQAESARQGEGLFQSLLALSFGEGLQEAFNA